MANWSVEESVQEFSKKTLGDEQDREAVTPKSKLRNATLCAAR